MKLWIASSILALSTTSMAAPIDYTLKEAYKSALEKTETLAIGRARINQADAKVDQAKSSFWPSISAGGSYSRQDSETAPNQSYGRLTVSQSLFEGGRDLSTLRARQADEEVQKHSLASANYSLFANVAQAFYGVLSGEREVDNLSKTISLAKDRIKELRNRSKIGKSRNIDLLAAEAQLSVLEAQLMAAQGDLVSARDRLSLVTGLSKDAKLIHMKERPDAPGKIDVYLADLEKRPDIAALKAQNQSARNSVDAAKAGHFPSLDLGGNYYYARQGSSAGNDWDVSLTLNFPLFEGGLIRAQVREAAEKSIETDYLLLQIRREAEISIRTAYNGLSASLQQLTALDSALKSTEQNYREQEKNYRFGQATNLDVLQALNLFQDTKRTLDKTRYLAFAAWAELKAATAQVSLANNSIEDK